MNFFNKELMEYKYISFNLFWKILETYLKLYFIFILNFINSKALKLTKIVSYIYYFS